MFSSSYINRLGAALKSKLRQWGLSRFAHVSMLNISENATFLAHDSETDRRLILRVHRPDYHTREEILSELAWIEALRQSNVIHTAAPVPTKSGETLITMHDGKGKRYVVAFEFMQGEEPNVGEHLANWFNKLGAVTAQLHAHSKKWQRPPEFIRKTWNTATMIGPQGYWGDWRAATNLDALGEAIISKAARVIESRLSIYGQGAERYGLVHADLRLANLLVDENRLGIIDFDDCGFCWFAYDFAAAISFHELDPSIELLQKNWLAGYRSVASFSAEEEAEIPTFILLRRILLTAWLSTHSETDTGQELGPSYTAGTVELAKKYLERFGEKTIKKKASSDLTGDKSRPILDLNAFSFEQGKVDDQALKPLIQRRYKTQGPTAMLFYQQPLHIVKGEGVWLFDKKGNKYLDVYNNVPSLGHCHPKVVAAISSQVSQLNVHSRYLHETVHVYAEKLLATMPNNINRLVMTCTGSESNDLALRLARTKTQKMGIIVSESAYHGNTQMVTEVSPASYKTQQPPDYVISVAVTEAARQGDNAGNCLLQQVSAAIKTLDDRGYGCAALLVDSIFSSDGIYSHPKGFLGKAVKCVRDSGGLFIADEVQSGFARTGDSMWGFMRHNIRPDIVTLGKPMGNGYPVSGVATSEGLLETLCNEYGYFNTFGGSTAAAAAALAVFDTIVEENLMQHARDVGAYFKNVLIELQRQHLSIAEVRGAGLYIGMEISEEGDIARPDAAKTTQLLNLLRRDHVLVGAGGKFGNVLKVRPPLCFSKSNADLFVHKLDKVLKELG